MKMICPKCGKVLEYDIPADSKNTVGKCPSCNESVRLWDSRWEYKIVTIRDLCGRKNLNESGVKEHAEAGLNKLAHEGWRVIGLSTQHVSDCSFAGTHNEPFFVLERDMPR